MSQRNAVDERRVDKRVPARLQIELTLDPEGPTNTASTINISANGVYFKSKTYIEPLTKLGLRLLLPGESTEGDMEAIDVQGIVVRIDPEEERADIEEYQVACYFTDSSPEFRERLGSYVQEQF